jgi:hypothetical protein
MALKITINGNELLDFVRVESGFDDSGVNSLLDAAKVEAEQFLNTDFHTEATDDEGVVTITEVEAPATVKTWVFNRVAQLYDNRGNAVTVDYTLLKPHRIYPFRG